MALVGVVAATAAADEGATATEGTAAREPEEATAGTLVPPGHPEERRGRDRITRAGQQQRGGSGWVEKKWAQAARQLRGGALEGEEEADPIPAGEGEEG